jgi:hypothetical protein
MKYHRTNWVQTESEFGQFQAVCKYLKKRDPKWTFQQCFTAWFQKVCADNGITYYQNHEKNFVHSNDHVPRVCGTCGQLFQRKLPGKDLKDIIYMTTCDTCLRTLLLDAKLWTKDHEIKYQIIMKGMNKNVKNV